MRHELKKIDGERKRFFGTFKRYGEKTGYTGRKEITILLLEIKDEEGKIFTNHLWFNNTKQFQKFELKEGDILSFYARVKPYRHRSYDRWQELDYKLSYPSKVEMINERKEVV
jgi:exonuclease VII large subunit